MKTTHFLTKVMTAAITACFLLTALVADLPLVGVTHAQADTNIASVPSSVNETAPSVGEEAKMPSDLVSIIETTSTPGVRQNVIVQFDGKISSKHLRTLRQAGGAILTRFEGINSVLASVPVSKLRSLATSNGSANGAVLTLTNHVAISTITPAATDYTDTITVVGAGLF